MLLTVPHTLRSVVILHSMGAIPDCGVKSGEHVDKFRVETAMQARTLMYDHNLSWRNLAQDEIGRDSYRKYLGQRRWHVSVGSVTVVMYVSG